MPSQITSLWLLTKQRTKKISFAILENIRNLLKDQLSLLAQILSTWIRLLIDIDVSMLYQHWCIDVYSRLNRHWNLTLFQQSTCRAQNDCWSTSNYWRCINIVYLKCFNVDTISKSRPCFDVVGLSLSQYWFDIDMSILFRCCWIEVVSILIRHWKVDLVSMLLVWGYINIDSTLICRSCFDVVKLR